MAKKNESSRADRAQVAVVVLVDNLGPKLYKAGQTTTDPEIVALLDDPRGLVRAAEREEQSSEA